MPGNVVAFARQSGLLIAKRVGVYDLSRFSLRDMTRLGIELRKAGIGAATMEDAAHRVTRMLFDQLRSPDLANPACALARIFVTMPFADLGTEQQAFARSLYKDADANPGMKCLTLLATAGVEARWNSRHESAGHAALPLPSAVSISRSPMIAQLLKQLGVELDLLLSGDAGMLVDAEQHSFNVFHVADARGSAHIPAQSEFVVPYGVRSVVGFGGVLPSGELFAAILFSREPITREVSEMFKTLALNVKLALLPFAHGPVFS